jgi:hypothetical protein
MVIVVFVLVSAELMKGAQDLFFMGLVIMLQMDAIQVKFFTIGGDNGFVDMVDANSNEVNIDWPIMTIGYVPPSGARGK